MQDDHFGAGLPLVVTVPLTTASQAGRFAGTVSIQPDELNGLRSRAFALVFQIRAVDRVVLKERIGVVSADQ